MGMYAMLLEKAFAKFCGAYDKLEGGQTIWAIRAMTGDRARWFARKDDKLHWSRQDLKNVEDPVDKRKCTLKIADELVATETMFDVLLKYHKLGSVLCASGSSGEKGLHKGHAYSILDVKKVGGGMMASVFGGKVFRLLRVRNPWGSGEWEGDWSDKSDLWAKNPKVKEAVNHHDADDGSFWMSWDDYVANWQRIGIIDRSIDITTIRMTIYDDDFFSPTAACLKGCGNFWCRCQGCKRLYCAHKSSDETIKTGGCLGFCQKSATVSPDST